MLNRQSARNALFLLLVFTSSVLAAEPLEDLTGPWQLFVDDYTIDEKAGVDRTYHAFQKHPGNPLIVGDQPWEGPAIYMYGRVMPNETRTGYRMWYHGLVLSSGNRLLYAESEDGINWTKPNLGNVVYDGSTDNNIYWMRDNRDHIASVIHTPWDLPDRQYKLINFNSGTGTWLGAWSANGTQFTDNPANPILTGTSDVGNFVYDYHRDEYLGYVKLGAYVNGASRRSVAITRSTDWLSFPQAQIVLKPDDHDDRWATGLQKTDFYGLCAFPYESMYLGFLWVLRVTDYIDVCQDGPIFVELVSSRDGVNWKRQEGDRPPILPLGGPYEWDRGMVFTAQQPLVENGEVKLYYGATNLEHCPSNSWIGGIGLATLRKDGFASLDAGPGGGWLTTRKLLGASEVYVNYQAGIDGEIRVEVLDENGNVVPGYSQADCVPLQGDSLEEAVTWSAGQTLPAISPLRLRFILQNASIYSFRAAAGIEVLQPPTITQQPTMKRVAPGGTAEFSVTAAGDDPLTYQWQADGLDLMDGGSYSGAQTPVLTVNPAVADASYRCLVTNSGGTTASQDAELKLGHYVFSEVALPGAATSTLSAMTADGSAVCGASGGRAVIWTPFLGTAELALPPQASAAAAAGISADEDGSLLVAVNASLPDGLMATLWEGTVAGTGDFTELPRSYYRTWSARGLATDGSEVWVPGSTAAGGQGDGRDAVMYRKSINNTQTAALPSGGHDNSDLHAVAENGNSAGQFQYGGTAPTGGARNGLLYTKRQGPIALNSLAGAPSTSYESVAYCISRDGEVLGGWSMYPGGGGRVRPVLWRTPTSLTTIPFAPGESLNAGEVHALNHDGSVAAGKAWNIYNPNNSVQAFIWDADNGTRKLQDVLIAQGFDLSGWILQDVTGMSADGIMMCGNGLHNGVAKGWVVSFSTASLQSPVILQNPQPVVETFGKTVTFEVAAIGDDPLSYQWQKDGVDIADGSDYAGTGTDLLTVWSVRGAVEGEYRCVVNNSHGQVISDAVSLTFITVRMDFDRDGDVDLEDYGFLQSCFSGSTYPQTDPGCAPALLDEDDDVDASDVAVFLNCWSGPGVPADLDCEP